MTETFQHPDGHHYRFVGFGTHAMPIKELHGVVFERVEIPPFPWTGPSGKTYREGVGCVEWVGEMSSIPMEDFEGLAVQLAKQAALNRGEE